MTSRSPLRILDRDNNCRLPRYPQDAGYTRCTPGALPLATSLKCNSSPRQRHGRCRALSRWGGLPVMQMAQLPPKKKPLLASPKAADIIINFFVLVQVCLVSATNALLSYSSAPAGCRRASRVQAGRPGAGRNKAVAHRMYSDVRECTSICPLNQGQKSAVKVYRRMYSIYTSIYFI